MRRLPAPTGGKNSGVTASVVSYSETAEQLRGAVISLCNALVELMKATGPMPAQLIIVNNRPCKIHAILGSRFIQDTEKQFGFNIAVVEGHGNIGFGKGHNLVLGDSPRGYHLIMNPDVVVDPMALRNGISYLNKNPDIGIVSAHATDSEGSKQNLCKQFPTIFDLFLRGFAPEFVKKLFNRRLADYEMRHLSEDDATKGIPIVSGCFMLCRSEILSKLQGFDPAYFLYFEDFDLSIRAGAETGIAYLPHMRIVHFGGNSAKKGLRHLGYFAQSAFRFFNHYGWRWIKR